MFPDEPWWWYASEPEWPARALSPVAAVFDWAGQRRIAKTVPHRTARARIVCVGNFTAGGTGKTPTALRIGEDLTRQGARVAFLTRGYKGRLRGPVLVTPEHSAAEVGDEPLLLARTAPTMVARDRVAGAQALEARADPPDVIVMDDGLQNPALEKDLVIAVVDAVRGVGNARVIPAGPLRMDLARQMEFVDAVLVNGADPSGEDRVARWFERHAHVPVLRARPEPAGTELAGQRVVAFAGIANPGRFEALLRTMGLDLVTVVTFPDHHAFTSADCRHLLTVSAGTRARLVTTEKDWVRLSGSPDHEELRAAATAVPIRLAFADRDDVRLSALLAGVMAKGASGTAASARPADAP